VADSVEKLDAPELQRSRRARTRNLEGLEELSRLDSAYAREFWSKLAHFQLVAVAAGVFQQNRPGPAARHPDGSVLARVDGSPTTAAGRCPLPAVLSTPSSHRAVTAKRVLRPLLSRTVSGCFARRDVTGRAEVEGRLLWDKEVPT